MKFAIPTSLLCILLGACAVDENRIYPNAMTNEEIVAYNETQDRIWDRIYCLEDVRIDSRIRKRYCATLTELRRRNISAEQMNNINFGTTGLFR